MLMIMMLLYLQTIPLSVSRDKDVKPNDKNKSRSGLKKRHLLVKHVIIIRVSSWSYKQEP